MIECLNCGKTNPDGNKFCGECGTRLPAPQNYCPKCNKTYNYEKFCTQCGTKLVNKKEYFEEKEQIEKEIKAQNTFEEKYQKRIEHYKQLEVERRQRRQQKEAEDKHTSEKEEKLKRVKKILSDSEIKQLQKDFSLNEVEFFDMLSEMDDNQVYSLKTWLQRKYPNGYW